MRALEQAQHSVARCMSLCAAGAGFAHQMQWQAGSGAEFAGHDVTSDLPSHACVLAQTRFVGMMQYDGDLKLPERFLVPAARHPEGGTCSSMLGWTWWGRTVIESLLDAPSIQDRSLWAGWWIDFQA